jgi:hypothetical protein
LLTVTYTGLIWDTSDNKWKLFDTETEPTTTLNTAGTNYTQGTIVAVHEGSWAGDTISETYLPNASTTAQGVVELATGAETTATSTDATRAVTPDGLVEWPGSANVTTLGTIGTGTWQGSVISTTYLQNQSGTNTGDEPAASNTVAGVLETATVAEANTGTNANVAVSPAALNGWAGSTNITKLGTITAGTIATTYVSNLSGTNTGEEPDATTSVKGIVD